MLWRCAVIWGGFLVALPVENVNDDNLLVAKAKRGDSSALTQLIKKHSKKVLQKAMSFDGLRGIDSDDLYQEGLLGLWVAVFTFDSSRQTKFITYAMSVATNNMLSAIRETQKSKHRALNSSVSFEENKNLLSTSPNPEELLLNTEEYNRVAGFINTGLTKLEKDVLKLSLLNMSYVKIAEKLGCSEKSVDNAIQRIRKKIRDIR